ncbi:hypothetical protein LCGC14_0535350 [marine sediment metagenome]|uniref:HK97 gp10 family phage protein n=1 Tax=marine sediment metagenome TaxID=412755 RepID=A0A0F9UFR0_9ZZZZ
MAKITAKWATNLKTKEATNEVKAATRAGLRDVVTVIAGEAIKGSPVWTGNNRRSIKFEVGPGGEVARKELEGAIYSTSGYGGILETGSVKMAARPYFKPALDRHVKDLPKQIKAHLP